MQDSTGSDFSFVAQMAGRNLMISLPVLLVWLAGLVFCIINWRKAPRAGLFALIGLVVLFCDRFFYFAASTLVASSIRTMSPNSIGWAYFFLGFFSSVLSAAGFALLILAIWAERTTTKT